MEIDRHGLLVLPRADALALLESSSIGRVVISDHGAPAAFPVNFGLVGEDVVFLTAAGTKLAGALRDALVAFEVDEIDRSLEGGWSVLVQGHAGIVSRADELEQARALMLRPWVRGTRSVFVRIRSESVSGRRLLAHLDPQGDEPATIDHQDAGSARPALAAFADPAFVRLRTVKKLCRVVELARATIGACDAAAVTLFGGDASKCQVCTNEVAHRLDGVQYRTGVGPGVEARTSSSVVTVDSIEEAARWKDFCRSAAETRIRSSLSIPLTRRGSTVGVLNLYSSQVAGFHGCEPEALAFGAAAGSAVRPAEG